MADDLTPSAPRPRSLRELRVERLLSIRELARLANVAPSTVYLIESGRSTPHPATMRRLAAALSVDPYGVTEFRRAIERRVSTGDLMDWIAELRGRLGRGELADLGSVDMHGVLLPIERAARILLADLADQDAEVVSPEQRHDPDAERRRQALLRDFHRLREQIG